MVMFGEEPPVKQCVFLIEINSLDPLHEHVEDISGIDAQNTENINEAVFWVLDLQIGLICRFIHSSCLCLLVLVLLLEFRLWRLVFLGRLLLFLAFFHFRRRGKGDMLHLLAILIASVIHEYQLTIPNCSGRSFNRS